MPVNNTPVLPDPVASGDFVSTALNTIDQVMQFGRQKHGLGGAQQQAPAQGGVLPTQSFADGGMVQSPANGMGPDVQQAMQYLSGADALPMPAVQQLERGTGAQDPDMAKLAAVHTAAQRGGPQMAWGLMQNYRKQYDLNRTNAAVKLAHGQLPLAAQAATQAYSNVLDGTKTVFTPGQDGKSVVAQVQHLGNGRPLSSVSLTIPQFAQLLIGNKGAPKQQQQAEPEDQGEQPEPDQGESA